MTIEKVFAGVGLAVCVVMLLRLCLGRTRQRQFDDVGRQLLQLPARLFHRSQASRQAAEAIRRAKGEADGDWKGNVYTPKSFKRPRKPH